jgi:predicted ATPase
VTLVGVGGVGKSRLAIQTAAEIADRFPDGVWLVELAAITDDHASAEHAKPLTEGLLHPQAGCDNAQ